tara:strand:+ start:146 stop:433 length:288 start_codon:yes stop_codon:yes gene_type:complete
MRVAAKSEPSVSTEEVGGVTAADEAGDEAGDCSEAEDKETAGAAVVGPAAKETQSPTANVRIKSHKILFCSSWKMRDHQGRRSMAEAATRSITEG